MTLETPNLTEMGVRNPHEIAHYSLVQASEHKDVLKIAYVRPKGSFLPKRRSYEFRRLEKPNSNDSHSGESRIRYEISPLLRKAVAELDALLAVREVTVLTKQGLQEEINSITADFTARLAELSKAINAMD